MRPKNPNNDLQQKKWNDEKLQLGNETWKNLNFSIFYVMCNHQKSLTSNFYKKYNDKKPKGFLMLYSSALFFSSSSDDDWASSISNLIVESMIKSVLDFSLKAIMSIFLYWSNARKFKYVENVYSKLLTFMISFKYLQHVKKSFWKRQSD